MDKEKVADETIVKYARVVYEVEVPSNASEEYIVEAVTEHIMVMQANYYKLSIDDIELHDRPYIADECNNDIVNNLRQNKYRHKNY